MRICSVLWLSDDIGTIPWHLLMEARFCILLVRYILALEVLDSEIQYALSTDAWKSTFVTIGRGLLVLLAVCCLILQEFFPHSSMHVPVFDQFVGGGLQGVVHVKYSDCWRNCLHISSIIAFSDVITISNKLWKSPRQACSYSKFHFLHGSLFPPISWRNSHYQTSFIHLSSWSRKSLHLPASQ